MIIEIPDVIKTLEDYNFMFVGGVMLPVTLDLLAGDTIEFGPIYTKIVVAAKKSPIDNSDQSREELTIFNGQLLSIQHFTRKSTQLSPEQAHQWNKTIQELTNRTVQ